MIAILIIIFGALVIWHLVWDGIIAPSERFRLRYELFALRDRLISLDIDEPMDTELFDHLHGAVNNAISVLPNITFSALYRAVIRLHRDEALQKRIRRRRELLDACDHDVVREIDRELTQNMRIALGLNTGGWLPYIVPFAIVMVCFKRITAFIHDIIAAPVGELGKLFPDIEQRTLNPT